MAKIGQFEFFLLRYVPDPVKGEFVNIAVVLREASGGFADVRFTRDWRRVRALDPAADLELLQGLESELRARLAEPADRERLLRLLEDTFANTLQLSATTASEAATSAAEELELLAGLYLESPPRATQAREAAGRTLIYRRMREAFEQAGVWALPQMRKHIAVAEFTGLGDPLRIDCGYRPNGVVRLFHAVSLAEGVDAAKVLAYTFPLLREGIRQRENAAAELTAVVADALDRQDEQIAFGLRVLDEGGIAVAPVGEMPAIAARAKQELKA